jgi:predicted DNA-binding ribbon-helix-helix protein
MISKWPPRGGKVSRTAMKSAVFKRRSIKVNGRKTSVSLEDSFGDALREVADEQRTSVTRLVGQIAHGRRTINLSGAIRLFLLNHFMEKFGCAGFGNSLAIVSNHDPSGEKELTQPPPRI